jgi:hypothetical protein
VSRHLDLLGILHQIGGALALLVAAALLLLALGALGLESTAVSGSQQLASGVAAGAFLTVALVCLAWAGANAWVGHGLRRVKPHARTAALIVALVNLFVLPFGTALSVYSLWVLLNNETRQRFEGGAGARA